MGMPECKIPFALTGKDISSKQQLLEPSFVFRSQLGVKSSDDLVYTQQLLIQGATYELYLFTFNFFAKMNV